MTLRSLRLKTDVFFFWIILLATIAVCFNQEICFTEPNVEQMPTAVRADLYRGQQEFTFAMLDAIQKATPNENIFFSPYSTYHALLLAYFGAVGKTEEELVKVLRLSWAKNKKHVNLGYRLEKTLRFTRSKKMPIEFASADKIYFDKNINLTHCVVDNFKDELESLNFRDEPEKCRRDINAWIANITRNEIPEVLSADDVSSDTQMILANAAYFKGQWANKFDAKDTKPQIFYTTKSQTFVPMMHRRGTYNLAIDEQIGAYILQMPYLTSDDENKDSEISMMIVLPPFVENGLENVLEKLNAETLEMALKESMPREIDITLPKFEFEQNIELVPILNRMGINLIFSHNAELSGFSVESNLNFGDAKHVAKIKVDEEGSTAAAATVLFSFRSARPLEPTKFECNHPFLFLIFDHKSKAILFTGIYRDPQTQNLQ